MNFSLRSRWSKLSAAMQFLILVLLIGSIGTGVAYATSLTLSDGEWVGLGSSAGRLEVNDLATDALGLMDANVGIGTTTPGALLDVVGTGGSASGVQLTNSYESFNMHYRDDTDGSAVDFSYVGSGGAEIAFDGSGTLLNASGANLDTRILGDADYYLLFADASADRVGISTSSPGATLDVDGSAIFNQSGADVDFRVESDDFPTALAVDAGDDRVEMDGFISLDPDSLSGYFTVGTVGSEQVITVTHSYVGVVGVTDLDCVAVAPSGPSDGTLLILHTGLSSNDVVTAINDADCSGNPGRPFRLAGDFAIGNTDTLTLIYWAIHDGAWHEISRSDN